MYQGSAVMQKAGDGYGMKTAESVAPAPGESGPEQDGRAGENDGGGAFCENGEAEEKSEADRRASQGVRGMIGECVVACQADNNGGEDHGDGQHAGERHVCSCGVGKADHADGGRKKQE